MQVAKQKKQENIAEYLLYMWQIEDMIRANNFDLNKIEESLINKYNQSEEAKSEIKDWYRNLLEMMQQEGLTEKGHLLINKNVIDRLTELHRQLEQSEDQTEYKETYYKTLPFIVELRAKSIDKNIPELETCFSALYGYLLLKLQNKEISGETQAAIAQISTFIRTLAAKYKEEQEGKLKV